MKVLLQGTGAADGIPAFFDQSRVSDYAWENGGKDVRTRSAALIDGHLKVDFGPDTFAQCVRDGVRPSDWSTIVFTHSHDDHFCRSELQYMLYSFTKEFFAPITIFGNEMIVSRVQERFDSFPFELIPTYSFESFDHLGYRITPVAAYHKLDEDSQNLLIQRDGRTLFYATDTGVWREETWEFLQDWKVDTMVLECTDGLEKTGYHGHLDIKEFLMMVDRLRTMGVLVPESKVITTHHCHLGQATHAELEAILEPHGVTVGYDTLTFDA